MVGLPVDSWVRVEQRRGRRWHCALSRTCFVQLAQQLGQVHCPYVRHHANIRRVRHGTCSMSRRLSAAVVGTNIGCTLHVRALRAAGFHVATLVGRDIERTRSRAQHFNVPNATTSLESVLDSDVDAIVIATPPETHHPFALSAFAARKHVLCEKPLALDLGQAREMRDSATESGLAAHIVHEFRWHAVNAALRHAVQSGLIGKPLQASYVFDHSLVARGVEHVPKWWLKSSTGGGWLRNWGSHGIDLVRYVVGEFSAVSAILHNDSARGMQSDDGYSFAFQLTNGAQGIMTGSCRAFDYCAQTRISGSGGTLRSDAERTWITDLNGSRELLTASSGLETLRIGENAGPPTETLPEAQGFYEETHSSDRNHAEEVYLSRALRNRILDSSFAHPAVASFDDGVKHMAVIEAVEKSAQTARWVELSV